MSGELTIQAQPGDSVYGIALCRGLVLKVSTLTLVTYVTANLSIYKVALVEQGGSGRFVGDVPVGTPAGTYDWYFYSQQGALPLESDVYDGSLTLSWSGTAATSDSSVIDNDVALISLNEAKEYLKITGTASDTVLSALINSASAQVQSYLGRNILRAARTEYYNGDGSKELLLKNSPIYSVTSVYMDQLRVFGSDTLLASSNYIVQKSYGILKAWQLFNNWWVGTANIKVFYYSGYSAGSIGTMPYDIRLAVKRMVEKYFIQGTTHKRLDVTSESDGNQSTTWKDEDIQKDVKLMLDPYKSYSECPQFSHAD